MSLSCDWVMVLGAGRTKEDLVANGDLGEDDITGERAGAVLLGSLLETGFLEVLLGWAAGVGDAHLWSST
jgi:hypothetical protein